MQNAQAQCSESMRFLTDLLKLMPMNLKLEKDHFGQSTESLSDKLKNIGASLSDGLEKLGKGVNKGLDKLEKTMSEVGKEMGEDLTKLGKYIEEVIDKPQTKPVAEPSEIKRLAPEKQQSISQSASQTLFASSGLKEYVLESTVKSVAQEICVEFSKACEIFKVLKQYDFPKIDLVNLTKEDYRAIFYCLSAHAIKKPSDMYLDLPIATRKRMTYWLMQGCISIEGADYYGPDRLGAILKHYTLLSSRPLPAKVAWGIRLAKIAIQLLTGVALPQVRTLYLASIWCRMGTEMLKHSTYYSSELGGAVISMLCGLIPSLVKEEIQGITLLFCNDGEGNWNNLSLEARKTWGKLTKNHDVDESRFAAWNKTLGVLIQNEKLSINGSSRMLSTYSMGTSFMRSICCKGNIHTFINGISPLPSRYSINNLIKLFRSQSDYLKRKNAIIYKELESITQSDERMKHIVPAYREVLKLKYAYLPGEIHSLYGTYCTTFSVKRDYSLIREIAGKFNVTNIETMIDYISHMVDDMEKGDAKFIEFFGMGTQSNKSGRLYAPQLTDKQKKRVKSAVTTLLIAGTALAVGEILEGCLDTEDVLVEGVDTGQADVYSGYINEEELMSDFNPEDIDGLPTEGAYNISFKSNVVLNTPGNGQSITAEVEKVPGTSNQFILKTSKGEVQVSGTDKLVTIDHIVYKIPKLK